MKIEIPRPLLQYAATTYLHLVPHQRHAGFQDLSPEERGKGDYMDLLGSLVLFNMFGQASRVCSLNITAGTGDDNDLRLRINDKWKSLNVKTSSYAPFSDRLHLYVKEEEVQKPTDFYVQVFVHTREDDEAPHVHVAGWIDRRSDLWLQSPIEPIPRTNHRGLCLTIAALQPFSELIERIDRKF